MKAKEYLAKFEKDSQKLGNREATVNLMNDFLHEITTLTEARKARGNSAMLAIVRELNQKWNALCRMDEKGRFKSDGFVELVKYRVKEDHPYMAEKILPELDAIK